MLRRLALVVLVLSLGHLSVVLGFAQLAPAGPTLMPAAGGPLTELAIQFHRPDADLFLPVYRQLFAALSPSDDTDAIEGVGDWTQLARPVIAGTSTVLKRDWVGAKQFGLSVGTSMLATFAGKQAIGRWRPNEGNNKSFPSGHTMRYDDPGHERVRPLADQQRLGHGPGLALLGRRDRHPRVPQHLERQLGRHPDRPLLLSRQARTITPCDRRAGSRGEVAWTPWERTSGW